MNPGAICLKNCMSFLIQTLNSRHSIARLVTTVLMVYAGSGLHANEWSNYGNNGTKFSELQQITPDNVTDLDIAWQYSTGELKRRDALANTWAKVQVNPLLLPDSAGGSLVLCTPFNRVIALDPATGEERWVYEPNTRMMGYSSERDPDGTHTPAFANCRGVAFWESANASPESECSARVFVATGDLRLIAVNAHNGKLCSNFGEQGTVHLEAEIRAAHPPAAPGEVKFPSPPIIVNDVIAVGSSVRDNHRFNSPNGSVRAFDVRSGKPVWSFDPIPRTPDDPVYAEWAPQSAAQTGGGNVWGLMTADVERDLIFMPTSGPSPDFFGGTRPGNNRYADSIVALRGKTGEVVWHFQLIHHNVWDYDNAAQPALVTLTKNGKDFPAVVQATKTGMLYIFHRETGEAFFPIEERAVPTDGVDGDVLSPTQPFPTAPPPLVPQNFSKDDIWGMTVFDRAACLNKYADARFGPIFTPPSLEGTVVVPSTAGGVNWGGGGMDPNTGLFVVNVLNMPHFVKLIPQSELPEGSQGAPENTMDQATRLLGTPYGLKQGPFMSPLFTPCSPPPWGELVAVNLQEGHIEWRSTLGVLDRTMPMPLPLRWGAANFGGPLLTGSGLVFIGATADDRFRAFSTATGEELWSVVLPSGAFALPMTYLKDGRQYVVIASGQHPFIHPTLDDHVTAFALPAKDKSD